MVRWSGTVVMMSLYGVGIWLLTLRVFFVVGFVFLIWVGIWVVITIRRMQAEQVRAMSTLNQLAALAGLQRATDKLQQAVTASVERQQKLPEPGEKGPTES